MTQAAAADARRSGLRLPSFPLAGKTGQYIFERCGGRRHGPPGKLLKSAFAPT
jgi:hypothetical protein